MQALILAGGEGTRLQPLTNTAPKPIVPVGNQAFLLRQIESLKRAGVKDIVLALSYQPTAIENALGGADYGVRLRYLVEPVPMGTAGAFKFAKKFLNQPTIVLNGDILTDIDLSMVAEKHKKYRSSATIVLTKVANPSAFGLVQIDKTNNVLRFLEKPQEREVKTLGINTINAGIYILEPEVSSFIPKNENYSFEYQLFPDLLSRKARFHAFLAEDNNYWLDIGTPESYLRAHHDLLKGKVKNININRNNQFKVLKDAEIDGLSLIADGSVISQGAKIINSVLGKDVLIEENTIIENSVIWSGTRICSNTRVSDSVLGNDCLIGKNVSLKRGTILGAWTILEDFTVY